MIGAIMSGIGRAAAGAGAAAGRAGATAGAAEAGIGEQIAGQAIQQEIASAPNQLRAKLAGIENHTRSPSGVGSTPVDSWFPSFGHTIFVGVSGGPDATLERIWKLALSTAFGRLRANKIATWGSISIECIWDISDKSVGVRLAYGSNGLIPWAMGQFGYGGEPPLTVIQRGPSQETVGGNYPDWFKTSRQLLGLGEGTAKAMGGRITPLRTGIISNAEPGSNYEVALERLYPALLKTEDIPEPESMPDHGRTITTAWKIFPDVQPPKPPTDDLVTLVHAAIMAPCYMPPLPPESRQTDDPEPNQIVPPETSELRTTDQGLQFDTQLDGRQQIETQENELRSGTNPFNDLDGYEVDEWLGDIEE
jgi:hypothetical protein